MEGVEKKKTNKQMKKDIIENSVYYLYPIKESFFSKKYEIMLSSFSDVRLSLNEKSKRERRLIRLIKFLRKDKPKKWVDRLLSQGVRVQDCFGELFIIFDHPYDLSGQDALMKLANIYWYRVVGMHAYLKKNNIGVSVLRYDWFEKIINLDYFFNKLYQ